MNEQALTPTPSDDRPACPASLAAPVDSGTWYLNGYLPEAGEVIKVPVDCSPFRVGRGADAAFCITRKTISSLHAEFINENGKLFIRDMKSTNGTFLNGERVVGRTPVIHNDLVQIGDIAFRILRQRRCSDRKTLLQDVGDAALALVQFDKLLSERALLPYFQPVVNLRNGTTIGYEALTRSRLVGLETPQQMFETAVKLSMEVQLSQAMRSEAVRISAAFPDTPHLFLNTHPKEIADEGFLDAMNSLRRVASTTPITIEIHESVVSDIETMKEIRAALEDLNMTFAFDDFGAGQGRLAELVEIRPDYLKFDRQILKNIHEAPKQHHTMVETLVKMTNDLGIVAVAEGIECQAEGELCRQLGFELAQGYYYGKPAAIRNYS